MDELKSLLTTSVRQIIDHSVSDVKLAHIGKKHEVKIHFVPKKYRILGGILQSMNIQFGNFIEVVIENILYANPDVEVLCKYSSKKSNSFSLSEKSESLIDGYMMRCQTVNYSDTELLKQYKILIADICTNEKDKNLPQNSFKHDVDVLFKNKKTSVIYYVEIKYNDDHDTGKFADISRKFLKTYAYLIREFNIQSSTITLQPILFYFNNKKMKGNIYLPEREVIYRGQRFFDTFTTVDYGILDKYMTDISESSETIALFDKLYGTIMH